MRMHFVERGSGEPLVLLHGNGEDHSYFGSQIDYFSKQYHVYALDTRGHGESPRGEKPFTLRQFAEDLKEFLDERELKQIYLLGFSDGGNIGLLFTLKYPEYVKKLILNGANLYPAGMKREIYFLAACQYVKAGVLSHISPRYIRQKELLGLMVHEPQILPGRLKKINCPVLVIAGTKDMIRREHTELIARSLKKSKLCIMEGTHFIARDCAGEFNSKVEVFLKYAK